MSIAFLTLYYTQDAVAHLSRLGVCGEDLGSLVEGDSGESSEGVEDGGGDSGNLAGIEDFSEIDEVNVPYII